MLTPTPSHSNILQNIIYISSQLVILQTLRAGYMTELDCKNKQEIKNFRSGAILQLVREILDNLEPYMEFLVMCEDGSIPMPAKQKTHIVSMIEDLTEFYTWAVQEVKLKHQRLSLMEIESQWEAE